MVALGIKEKQAFEICRKYDMLSPLYDTGVGRDGCFFCPNAGKKEREILYRDYPELAQEIYDMISKTNIQVVLRLQHRNNWIKDYLENNGELPRIEQVETSEKSNNIDGQMSIFDYPGMPYQFDNMTGSMNL